VTHRSARPPGDPDSELARELAVSGGRLLLDLRSSWAWADGRGEPDRELGRRGDRKSNDLILSGLARRRPLDAVLSEESADDPRRLTAGRVWIIDPLDGTREFSMPGREDWAVHVALWESGSGITAAAVSQPALGEVYSTNSTVTPGAGADPVMLVSDSRPPAFAGEVAAQAGLRVQPMGSAGAKAMAVVRGAAGAYLHAGGQWEWDSAAPVGVALSAGLHASRIDGSELMYNQSRPYLPDLLICRSELAETILSALNEILP
jgi:3'(2'), 5'-bisphosphate nucleotidase